MHSDDPKMNYILWEKIRLQLAQEELLTVRRAGTLVHRSQWKMWLRVQGIMIPAPAEFRPRLAIGELT